jgi:diaminopimelate decarboxylase
VSIDSLSQHPAHPHFEVRDDCLLVGGQLLTDIAASLGRTPFYVYDRAVMTRCVQQLRAALAPAIKLHFAMKANPMPVVVRHMVSLVDGIDVASAGELQVALQAGAKPDTISFAGPGKTKRELESAAAAGIVVNLESEREMRALADIARQTGVSPRVAVRVNPDFELKTSGMKMGGGPRQFGIDAERVPAVLAELGGLPLDFRGFHIFAGSQNLRADAIVEAQSQCVELAVRLAAAAPAPVRLLNIGGGLGIPYFPGEKRVELSPVAANLAQLQRTVATRLPEAELTLELGRYLVGEAGLYVCRVIERKVSRGQVFLVTDGGLHHHLAASGNFGQVIRKNYPVAIGNRMNDAAREMASVVGPLCTPLDLLADRMELPVAQPGDYVVVFQSGAYGATASPQAFLGHPPPAEALV